MYQIIQGVAKFYSQRRKSRMDLYPELVMFQKGNIDLSANKFDPCLIREATGHLTIVLKRIIKSRGAN